MTSGFRRHWRLAPIYSLALLLLAACADHSTEKAPRENAPREDTQADASVKKDAGAQPELPPFTEGTLPPSMNVYLPFDEPDGKYFNDCERPVAFVGSKEVPAGTAAVLQDASGSAEYFVATSKLVGLGGLYAPIATSSGQPSDGFEVLFGESIPVWSDDWSVGESIEFEGDGSVMARSGSEYPLRYTGATTYGGEEHVEVAAGEFDTVHVQYAIEAEVTAGGEAFLVPLVVELWLAEGIGIVRRVQNKMLFELTQIAGEHDTSMNAATHCPYSSVEQEYPYRQFDAPFVVYRQGNRFQQDGPVELFVAPLSGTREPQRLNAPIAYGSIDASAEEEVAGFRVSPDARQVAYTVDARLSDLEATLFVLDLKDGQSAPLKRENETVHAAIANVYWSPDSSRIAYLDAQGALWTHAADGSDPQLLADKTRAFAWSPDGTHIAFEVAELSEQGAVEGYEVYIVGARGGESLSVGANDEALEPGGFLWAPDGKTLAYQAVTPAASAVQLLFVSTDGKLRGQVSSPGMSYPETYAWSPDGDHIAYAPLGSGYIVVFDVQSGTRVSVSPEEGNQEWYQWSHDGTRLAFTLETEDRYGGDLYTVAPDGGETVLIDGGVLSVRWSPVGRDLLYMAMLDLNDADLYVAAYDGSKRTLINTDGGEVIRLRRGEGPWSWSPDGSRVAFRATDPGDQQERLYTNSTDGTELVKIDTTFGRKQLSLDQGAYLWTTDASRLLFRGDPIDKSNFELYSADATKPGPTIKLSGTTHQNSVIYADILER